MYQESKLSHYINKANSLIDHKFEKKIRVALLSSFTVNGLEEVLRVKSAEKKTEYGFHDMIRDLNVKLTEAFNNMNSVYLYDFNRFVMLHGEKNVFDFQQFHFGDIKVSLDYIPYLAHDLMSYIIAISGLSKKCIVLDLDNTLWGGIAGEDGFDGIKLGPTTPGNA